MPAAPTGPSKATLRQVLTQTRTIALIGFSPKPERPSHAVARFLQQRGYRVLPVNPGIAGQTHLGESVLPDLRALPAEVDMVDIFRNSEAAADVVAEAIALREIKGFKTIWMQLGVIHHEAAARAQEVGFTVVMDRCPKIEIPRLGL